jgi:predicted metal-dependent phosphotriesterase family hydrolase
MPNKIQRKQRIRLKKIILATFIMAVVISMAGLSGQKTKSPSFIMTVNGPVDAADMGITLSHEHIVADLIGADKVSKDRYDPDEVCNVVLPLLKKAREFGCQTLVECTPPYMARDPELVKRLSAATGLHILMSTGYSAMLGNRYLPPHVFSESADQLSQRLVEEWNEGMDNTGIKPGIIKTTFDFGSLPDLHKKIVRAAGRAHLQTGLTIASHTMGAVSAFEQMDILKEEGVDPTAFIWVHTQVEKDTNTHIKAAKSGAWVSFDVLSRDKVEDYVALIANMKSANLLDHVLLSHDSLYWVGKPGGGDRLTYTRLFEELLPALRESGFTEDETEQMLITNPKNAFAVRVRALKE